MSHRKLLCAALLGSSSLCAPALAQTAPPPAYYNADANGVDPVTGAFNATITEGSIGSGPGAISLQRIWAGFAGQVDNWASGVATSPAGGTELYVQSGALSDVFSVSGTTYTSMKGDGSTLIAGSDGYTYTSGDGTVVQYSRISPNGYQTRGFACANHAVNACALPRTVTKPDGTVFTLTWTFAEKCQGAIGSCLSGGSTTIGFYRLGKVSSSAGYSMTFTYKTNSAGPEGQPQPPTDWFIRTGATFANSQSTTGSFPTVTYSYPSTTLTNITDALGRTWGWDIGSTGFGSLDAITRPGASSASTTINYGSGGTSIVKDGVTANYSRVVSGTTATTTITGTSQPTRVVVADLTLGQVTKVTVQASGQPDRVTQYGYDTMGRLTSVIYPEGNKTTYAYDGRGNVMTTTMISKTPGTPANIVTSAVYPTSCTNTITCNKPTSTTDARLNETDYTYDPTHGGVLSVTQPLVGGVHPQTRYTYTRIDKTGAASATGTFVLSTVSACRTNATCAGTADEVKASLSYGANMLPSSTSRGSGDGLLTATTAATYDGVGNTLTIDGPLAGTVDLRRYLYDADREVTEAVGPDPDGAGVLKNRTQRYTYNADGQVTLAEQGTSAADGSAFASLQQLVSTYDGNARKIADTAQAGTMTYAATQYSYDAAGRSDCTAQRMNLASLPAACTLGAVGSFGQDRISRNSYDGFGELAKVTTAYGVTGFQRDEVTYTYNANGTVRTLADAKNNLTTYSYDGFDRLFKTQYPSPMTPGTSSTTDYEQLGYDPNGNVISQRLRDGHSVGLTFDALNRETTRSSPHIPTAASDPSTGYGYDLLGYLTSATDENADNLSFAFDALGRMTSQTSVHGGTKSMQYDLAGRRTRLTWQDSFYVTYDYDNVDEMTAIHENGAAANLVGLTYDDLGERKTKTYANGTNTTYGYDPISRLTSLALNGSTNANTITLGNYSPAGEIGSRTQTNDAYAFPSGTNGSQTYTANGLNQYSAVAGTAQTFDARGNATNPVVWTIAYNSRNEPVTSTSASFGSSTFGFDPLGRLDSYSATAIRPDYDGEQMITELNASGNTVARRYVFGPGTNEPLVWYEGSGTMDKRFLDGDERGSIVRGTDASGAAKFVDTYDEYGQPTFGATGSFLYAGQYLVGSLSAYYARNRMYSPSLGRFLQTDPIGYADGPNWYNYVGSDPINWTDPMGDKCWSAGVVGHDSMAWKCDHKIPTNFSPGTGLGPAPSGGGGGRGAGTPSLPALPQIKLFEIKVPRCSAAESALRAVGSGVSAVGSNLTDAGIIATGVGAVVGIGGALTGDVPAAAVGAIGFERGANAIATGGFISFVGAGLQILGGAPKAGVTSIINQQLLGRIPLPEGIKAPLESGLDKLEDQFLPEGELCGNE